MQLWNVLRASEGPKQNPAGAGRGYEGHLPYGGMGLVVEYARQGWLLACCRAQSAGNAGTKQWAVLLPVWEKACALSRMSNPGGLPAQPRMDQGMDVSLSGCTCAKKMYSSSERQYIQILPDRCGRTSKCQWPHHQEYNQMKHKGRQ